ncbi:MAG: efflux RND transporter periplasmic adaptor subunit [Stenotrophomonas rhizophila]|uniref:efflux RND transporter periplasmic adaptor subunit n=1 Tax=Stenotrophomonas rhizophila TaxID=216778 RepID=UPI0010BF6C2C|nr:efflux RND transporter periplasmic adaptor subunit [Stenotrophomonas rhizophila]MDY0953510.1 efflux RND transporter periplasmic adaptor subunit [Stenotrophomonas rhizophila]TKK08999.1 efflux transporter periplasmic adaptor subunit [Stenotrophomonas rhizophila]
MKPRLPTTRRGRVLLLIIVIAVLGAIVAWSLRKPAAPALATTPVSRGDIEQTVEATGVIDAYKLVSVGAQASGQIKSLKVQLGDSVKQGDLIAEIDATTQENQVLNAQATLDQVKAQRSVQQASLREAELEFARQQQMLAAEATSRAEYDAADAKLKTARAQIQSYDAQIKGRETELGTARANLAYTRIIAPMDGTVVAVVAEEGRTVNANQTAPTIVMLARLDLVTVNAEVSEADVVKIKAGMPVYFTTLGEPDRKYHATLRQVNPAPSSIANDSSSSSSSSSSSASSAVYYNALFDVENPDGTLRIDMTAQVSVMLKQAKGVLTIPAVALGPKTRDGQYMVRVADADGMPTPRKVKIGINNGATAEVLSGLKEGEKVVVGEGGAAAGGSGSGGRGGQVRIGGPGMGGPRR